MMMATAPALALAVAALAAAPSAPRRATGRVRYATAHRLYLDAGARDGLLPGSTLRLLRGDKQVATCRIEAVSETHATCSGAGRQGDAFALPNAPASAPAPEKAAPPLSEAETARRRHALEAARFSKVEYRGPAPLPAILSGRTEVQLAHTSWGSEQFGPWQEERVDVWVRGAPVGGGFALYADMSARRWSPPAGASVRPATTTQLYVWEAALARRPLDGGLTVALGRVRPWSTPGSTVIDGAQAGFRTKGNLEVGVFGGGVPDPNTLAPSFRRTTGGAYLAMQSVGGADATLRYLRNEFRLAYSDGPELGRRYEGEALAQISLGSVLDLGAQARASRGESGTASLDAVAIDAGLRPFESFSLLGGFRYQGVSVLERDGVASAPLGGAARHADLTATWELASWLTLSGVSGLMKDLTTGAVRRYAGPELGLPRLFGDVGGISIGYLEEDGWSAGRSGFLQVLTRRPRFLQILLRASWFQTRTPDGLAEDELSAYAALSAQLGPAVSVRVAATGRAGGYPGTRPLQPPGTLFGGTLDTALSGRF